MTIDISYISVIITIITGGGVVGAVGVSGLGAKREIDAQVWWTFDGLQGSMDGLKRINTSSSD